MHGLDLPYVSQNKLKINVDEIYMVDQLSVPGDLFRNKEEESHVNTSCS